MNASDLESALNWRYATKQFDPSRKISDVNWKALEQALLLTPSSYGLQPWKFLVIQSQTLKEKLRAVSWNQAQVTDCSHYIVMLYKEKTDEAYVASHVDRTAEVREIERSKLQRYEEVMAEDLLKGPRASEIDFWAKNQTYIAMGFLLQAAAVLKVDACPMEGLDPSAYDDLLSLKGSGYLTLASVALGYRSSEDRYHALKKVRFPISKIIEYL